MSREVADAFISVHGDLDPFRKDLNKANGSMKKWAEEQATEFSDAWGQRMNSEMDRQWNSVVDSIHSGKKIDFSRMIDNFDSTNIDNAVESIGKMLDELERAGKLENDQHITILDNIVKEVDARKAATKALADHKAQEYGWQNAQLDMMEKLREVRERNADHEKALTEDVIRHHRQQEYGWVTAHLDMMDELQARRIRDADHEKALTEDVIRHHKAQEYGWVTTHLNMMDELKARRTRDADHEKALIEDISRQQKKAAEDYKAAWAEATRENDRFNRSLEGMLRSAKFKDIERDYRSLTHAMATGDWSNIARGSRNIDDMRNGVRMAVADMRSLGRISTNEAARIGSAFEHAAANADRFRISFRDTTRAVDRESGSGGGFGKFRTLLSGIWSTSRGLREHLGGFAGMNVFGDMISQGLDFIHNLDRIAVSAAITATKLGVMGSAAGAGLAGAAVIVADLGQAIAGLSVAVPAFAIGAGISIGVLVSAFKDMKTVLKDLTPAFTKLQDQISAGFWDIAAQPIRDLVHTVLPSLSEQLVNTGQAWGIITKEIADGLKETLTPDYLNTVFDRMNFAINSAHRAVKPLIRAFANLGDTGSKYFGRASDAIVGMAEDFDRFIQKAHDNGDLEKWVERGIKGFKDMGRTIDGTLGIFNAIDKAARAAGYGGLSLFADRLQAAAAIMQSPRFQASLTTLFEGMGAVVSKVGTAIRNLGPAVESIIPFVKQALSDIGDTAAIMIGYIGKVLADPAIHLSMINFSGAMVKAMEKLAPAVQPFTDSLAHAMDLLGKVLVATTEVIAAFTVGFSPILDQVSAKMATLIDPIKNLVIKVLEDLKPAFELLVEKGINPMIDGVRENLIPALDGAVTALKPMVDAVVTALAPALGILARDILPGVVKIAGDLAPFVTTIVKLADPLLKTFFEGLGTAVKDLAKSMDDFTKAADPFLDRANKVADKAKTIEVPHPPDAPIQTGGWSDYFIKLGAALAIESPTARFVGQYFDKMTKDWQNGWNTFANGVIGIFNPEQLRRNLITGLTKALTFGSNLPVVGDVIKNLGTIIKNIGKAWDGLVEVGQLFNPETLKTKLVGAVGNLFAGINIDSFNGTVNKWFDDTVFKPIRDSWDNALKGLDGWWKDVKSGFQTWMNEKLGFGKHDNSLSPASVSGGGGGKGMGVGATILPSMLDQDAEKSWLDQFNTDVNTNLKNFWDGLGANLTSFGADVKTNWDDFWGGFGAKVSEIWQGIVDWVTTKYTEISDGITQFVTDVGTNWNAFWDGVGAKVSEIWDGITTWISTKYTEISTGITTWITDVQTGWNSFWDGVNQKVIDIWNAVVTWITTKYTEISTGIGQFITDVQTGWNSFWDGVNQKAIDIWNAVTSWIDTKRTEIKNGIDNFVTDVRNNWNGFWDGVNQKVTDIWNAVTGWISGKVSEIRGNIDRFIGDVRTNWDNFWNGVKDKVTTAWDNIRNGVQTGVDNVVSFVRGLPGKITSALGNLGSLLLDHGAKIMDGLRQGIVDGFEKVKGFVSGIANWIAEHKGPISYDKVLLIPAGQAIMDGLLGGLSSKMGALTNLLTAITDSMNDTIVENLAKSKMYVAGADAALGLAQGLKDNKNLIEAAVADLSPSAAVNVLPGAGGIGSPTPAVTKVLNVAEGAIKVVTPTEDPALVAARVIDEFSIISTF